MFPTDLEIKYIFQIGDIQSNFVIYNNKYGRHAPINAIRAKYCEPNPNGPSTIELPFAPTVQAASTLAAFTAASSSTDAPACADEPEVIDNELSLNGNWVE